MSKHTEAQYAAKIEFHNSTSGYTHYLTCRLEFVRPNGNSVREFDSFDLNDLKNVSAQGQADSDSASVYYYGYNVEYDSHFDAIQLDEAQKAVKVLSRLQKSLDKMDKVRGFATTFAEFAARVCEAAEVSLYLKRTNSYQEEYISGIDTLRADIDARLREFANDCGKVVISH